MVWTYRLEDLLLFSPRVYWRLFELNNAAWWPLQLVTCAAGLGLVLLVSYRPRGYGRWVMLTLAAAWAFVAWSFLWNRFSEINWAIAYIVPVFLAQVLLLAIAGLSRNTLLLGGKSLADRLGLALAVVGVVAYPFLPPLFGRPWTSAEIFGLAPDPTAVTTIGLLLGARSGLTSALLVIPVLWLLLSGLTLWTMGDAQMWLPLLAGSVAIVLLPLRSRIR